MDAHWSQRKLQATPSQKVDDEPLVLEVPNQREIDSVAALLQQRVIQNQPVSGRQAVHQLEALFQRLEALHDNIQNEKAILYNKLHKPLEKFAHLECVEGDAEYDFRRRATKLLSVWRRSLKRKTDVKKTPTAVRYSSPASTPAGVLFIPRSVSTTPEYDEEEIECRNSTSTIAQETPTSYKQDRPVFERDASVAAIAQHKFYICGLCDTQVPTTPASVREHLRLRHRNVMGRKLQVPRSPIEYCQEHDQWFVCKNRGRHFSDFEHEGSMPYVNEALVFDATRLSILSRKRPTGNRSKLYGKKLNLYKAPPSTHAGHDGSDDSGPISDRKRPPQMLTRTDKHNHVSNARQGSLPTSGKIDDIVNLPHNSHGSRQRRASTASSSNSDESPYISEPELSRRSCRLQQSSSELREQQSENLKMTHPPRKRVKLTSGIFGRQHEDFESVQRSDVKRLVRERISDDDFVSDVCDISGHHSRVLHLEAENELLKRRNEELQCQRVVLESERATFRALARRAMHGDAGYGWNGRQEALDRLVRGHLSGYESD